MNQDLLEIQHTHTTCPFCGHRPGAHEASQGINCKICTRCADGLSVYTPMHTELYTEDGCFELWKYTPIAKSWRESKHYPIFLDPYIDKPIGELSQTTQEAITAFYHSNHSDIYERTKKDQVDNQILKIISRHQSPDIKRTTLQSLKEKLTPPILKTSKWVYSPNSTPLEDKSKNHTQSKLTF